MQDFIHDSGAVHEGEPFGAAAPPHPGGIHAGDVHDGAGDLFGHAGLGAEQSLGTMSTANEIGNPNEYERYWFYQRNDGYCAPSSITQVIEAQTGHTLNNYNLVVQEAHDLGIPTGASGITIAQAQQILAGFDVPSHIESPASDQEAINDLATYLEQGRNVILSVNASPIWYGSDTAGNPTGQADHALVVTAINAQTGVVTLSDPGNPNGNQEQVPLSVFMDAWHASGDQMLVTDYAAGTDNNQVWTAAEHIAGTPGTGLPEFAAPQTSPPNVALPRVTAPPDRFTGFVVLPVLLGVTVGAATRAVKHARRGR